MSMDNNIDYHIKPDLLKDIFNMLDFESYDSYEVSSSSGFTECNIEF